MENEHVDKTTKNYNIVILYSILFFSCASLMVVNYITIRILSASRGFVNGESNYSKGQNKASRHLITYLYTENSQSWKSFKEEINIPLGDQFAKDAIIKNHKDDVIKIGFLAGKNKIEDFEDMIWLYRNFHSVPFFKNAIANWKIGDKLVNRLYNKGIEVHNRIEENELDKQEKDKIAIEISLLCDELSIAADNFSNILGDGTRGIKNDLIMINTFFIVVIISCTTIYYTITLRKITNSEKDINIKKKQLDIIIDDLEKTKIELSIEIIQHKKLIGTISHDIKSPLKYLIVTSKYIYEESKNYQDEKFRKNAKSIYSSTMQLYNFIDSLLTYSKIFFEGKSSENTIYHLKELVTTKCALFREIAEASNIALINEIDVNFLTTINKEILSVILHNILDNAIKNTDNGSIKIYSEVENKKLYIIVEDTGKGFKKEELIYYNELTKEHSAEKLILKNHGMGIPMMIELIQILHGDLKISSTEGKGSKLEIITDYN
jgi:signal transduction histidine kinase